MEQKNKTPFPVTVYRFYRDGFREMTLGKTLWLIILIKLFIVFAILRVFFFPDFLSSKGNDDSAKSEYVGTELINRKTSENK
ncbi:MAG: DUF4492 domain-containing protein [Bacteroidales bacterium]